MSHQDPPLNNAEVIQKIQTLLESNQEENVLLALQLIPNSGVSVSNFFTHLYLLWEIHLEENTSIANQTLQLLESANSSEKLDVYLKKRKENENWDLDVFAFEDETAIYHLLEQTEDIKALDTPLLANLAVKLTKHGGSYCLKKKTAPAHQVISWLIDEDELNLYDFALSYLPKEIGLFPHITSIDICGNHLTDIHDELRHLDKLEFIYFEKDELNDRCIQQMEAFFPVAMAKHYASESYVNIDKENYEEALYTIKKAIALDHLNARAWYMRGIVSGRLKHYEEALAYFDKTTSLDPLNTEVFSNKALCFLKMKNYQACLETAEAGLALHQQHPNISKKWQIKLYGNKGLALFHLQKYEASHQAYDQALQIDANSGQIWYNKACNYAQQQNRVETLTHLKEAIRCDPATFQKLAPLDHDFEKYWQDEDFLQLVNS